MSAWTEFVKANYAKVKHLPNKERLKELSAMFKGKAAAAAPAKAKRGRKAKAMEEKM